MLRAGWSVSLAAWLLVAELPACSGPPVEPDELDLEAAAEYSLGELEALVRPYALEGRTADGLALLDGWLLLDQSTEDRRAGHRLRADSLVELWIFAQIASHVDPAGAARALEVVAERLIGAGPRRERPTASELVTLLHRRVEEDYAASGATNAERELALALVDWDPTRAAASAPPPVLLNAGGDPRSRLLLAGTLLHNDERYRSDRLLERPRLADVAWLCGGQPDESVATLADRCGFWCAALPERSELAPAEEHDIHELGGDDRPVEVDVSPLAPEAYAAYLEATDVPESPWFPTPGDVGYELVQACGAEYFGLPADDGVVLLSERSYLDLVYLLFAADLLAQLELDLLRGEPVVVLSSDVLGAWADGYTRDGLVQELTPAALAFDARLELPPFRAGSEAAAGQGVLAPRERLLLVRSDAVSLTILPRLKLERRDGHYRVAWAESETGYHYPGLDVVEMARLNRLDDDQVSDDRIPLLRRDLEDLERSLWLSAGLAEPDQRGTNACGGPEDAGLAVLADGSTYFETLRPTLKTVLDCGYAYLDLVALEPSSSRLVPLRVAFVTEPDPEAHRLEIENGRLAFRPWTDAAEVEPFRPDAREEAPLVVLYRHLAGELETGVIDPGRPLMVTIMDERVDTGTLMMVLQALLYRREGEATSDRELLASPPATTREGLPQELFPAGLVIYLR